MARSSEEVALAHTVTAEAHPLRGRRERAETPAVQESIGRFAVLEVLGRGGTSIVVSAHDPLLDRRVAIKLITAVRTNTTDDVERERLLREARAMARLRHRNVVTVHEVGEHRGQVYLAMEQVGGGTLRQTIAALAPGRNRWREVLELFTGAGHGLAAAHADGIVHRDFKLDNVLVDHDGRVLVADFGLADLMADDRQVAEQKGYSGIRGTPAYMAPEQWTGQPVDARADQFAYCVALYEALYKELPFAGATQGEYLEAVRAGQIRRPADGHAVPAWVQDVLARGLAARPEDRYPSVGELMGELGLEPMRQPGEIERWLGFAACGGFVVAWAVAALGFDIPLTYELHYATDLTFLLLASCFVWLSRRSFARTAYNQRALSFGVSAAIAVVALTIGGQLLGIPADTLGSLHLLVIGSSLLTAAATFKWALAPNGAIYLATFFASAAWPRFFWPLCLVAHAAVLVGFFLIFPPRR